MVNGGVQGLDSGTQNTEPGSPTGAVRLTSPPCRLGSGALGAWNARLSFDAYVNRSRPPARGVGTVAESVCVLHESVGEGSGVELRKADSWPVWKHGASVSDEVLAALPTSIANHPVHPASVNGLPPFPVWIT